MNTDSLKGFTLDLVWDCTYDNHLVGKFKTMAPLPLGRRGRPCFLVCY